MTSLTARVRLLEDSLFEGNPMYRRFCIEIALNEIKTRQAAMPRRKRKRVGTLQSQMRWEANQGGRREP